MTNHSNDSVEQFAYARAGLLGNPSDGYNGKTISIIVRNFRASVRLSGSDRLSIRPGENEGHDFGSIEMLASTVDQHGYYGGVRLLKAAIKRFYDYAKITKQKLHNRNFELSYSSTIPRQVGLAGSSAIVMATIRGLMDWYSIPIPPHQLASLTLAAESELGIPAGLQDRVIQAYEGLVYMDFSVEQMKSENGLTFGAYEPLDTNLLSNLYIAYASNAGEPTEVLHNDLRQRYSHGDSQVTDAMITFARFAEDGRLSIINGDTPSLSRLIDQNFDLRNEICPLHSEHRQMIQIARAAGASAKYCGSGGAIIGTFHDKEMLCSLKSKLKQIGCQVILPDVG